ncbi:MAG: hypothetical protein MR308_10335 [Lachnospiraceae bacterium]|nr:hypothetical protein [Lachnospiraceae bacterium]
MGEVILLAAFVVVGILGYFVMKKIDWFLEQNYPEVEKRKLDEKDIIP